MPTSTTATIAWSTDVGASTLVEYGTTTAYGQATTYDPARITAHSVTLTGLNPGVTYFYRVTGANGAGVRTTATGSFQTTSSAAGGRTIAWVTDQPASGQVDYGTGGGGTYGSGTYGSGTYGGGSGSYTQTTGLNPVRTTNHSFTLTGLSTDVTYSYRITSRNGAGIATQSSGTFLIPGGTVPTATGAFVIGLPSTIVFSGVGTTDVPTGATASGVFVVGPVTVVAVGGPVTVTPPPPVNPANVPPIPVVEVSFLTNPALPPIWEDISPWVEAISISRGRQRELNQIAAGTCQVTLNNMDRRFDPTNTAGHYAPNVLPMRRIRIRASYNSSYYALFSGYVESWAQDWQGFQNATVTITATDAFKPFNLVQLNTSYPTQTSDARINAVLNTINWTVGGQQWLLGDSTLSLLGSTTVLGPTGDRSIGAGQSVIAAATLSNTSALQHMQDVATSEYGLLYTNKDGLLVFLGRNAAINISTSLGNFGELELPYVNIVLAYDDTDIWNDIRVTATGGTPQVASNAASQQAYFTRTLQLSTLLNSDAQALSLAQALLNKYAQPKLQIVSMTLDGSADPANIYPQILGRELGEQVTVHRRPPAGGLSITQFSSIQGIAITYDAALGAEWQATWRLSPADTSTYWALNNPTYSILGSTTRLFF